MIIDEIIDAKERGGKLNLEYVYEEAELFGMDYITEAVEDFQKSKDDWAENEEKARQKLIKAIEKYIDNNGYNEEIKKYIPDMV